MTGMDPSEDTDGEATGAVTPQVVDAGPGPEGTGQPVETDQTVETDPAVQAQIIDISDPQALSRAAAMLKEGECVVLPTDTVYGIGADAMDPIAVQRLLMAKGRGRDMPPPVLIGDAAVLPALCDRVPPAAQSLAEAYWPGGLTLIFHAQQDLTMDLGETNGTIAVRVPDQDSARDLLRITGPLAVSSANKSGQPAALSAQDAAGQLGTSVALYLDAGPSRIGEASTIIDFASTDQGKVVRQGALSLADIHLIAPDVVALEAEEPEPAPDPESTPDPAGSTGEAPTIGDPPSEDENSATAD